MKLAYPACFCKDEETGAYAAEVPDLPGCATGGNTLADALLMAVDAASGWVLTELEEGRPAPPASPLDAVQPGAGGFVSLLALDMDSYAKKFGGKAVRKNLTIPAWLNTFAESSHVNFSQVLQDSLTEMYRHKHEQTVRTAQQPADFVPHWRQNEN
jgi:predicted RNase H-like HicB family nuclease